MRANSLLGVWPFIFEDNPKLRKIYDVYSRCTFIYYLLFIITAIIKLIILICDEVVVVMEVVANVSITVLYSISAMRVWAIKTPRVKEIIKEIIVLEDRILKSEDEKIISIYNSYAMQSKISNIVLWINIFLGTSLYFIHPLYEDDLVKYYESTNITVVERPLPLSSWFPFDAQKHYLISYLWLVFDGLIGASFVTYSDILTFSLIIFSLGQIKILIHILSNFEMYVIKIKDQIKCSPEEASFITLRECILKHNEIIRYIKEFNTAMKNMMVLDFLLSSLQLATIVLQLLVVELSLMNIIHRGQSAFSMFIRLLVYYWYANEVMLQSSDIGHALCASNWYNQPEKIKKMLMVVLLQCNRLLCLEIGPFGTMTLGTFLGILKATYSYMMLVYE